MFFYFKYAHTNVHTNVTYNMHILETRVCSISRSLHFPFFYRLLVNRLLLSHCVFVFSHIFSYLDPWEVATEKFSGGGCQLSGRPTEGVMCVLLQILFEKFFRGLVRTKVSPFFKLLGETRWIFYRDKPYSNPPPFIILYFVSVLFAPVSF